MMPRTQSPTPARATSWPAPTRDRSSKNLVSATRIADSRPSAVAQRALSEAAKTSSRVTRHKSLLHAISGSAVVMRQRALSEMVANSPRVLQQKASADALQGVRTGAPEAVAQLEPEPNRTGLPDQLKTGVESLSGMSLDGVKIHYNSARPAQLNALAYAQGSDIHVAPGQEKHLPHEAWHVVQQAQGRVKPTMQMKSGVAVNNDSALESEADVMGAKALQMKGAPSAGGRQEVAEACPSADRSGVTQLVRFMNVKRIANHGNLYVGLNVAGPPNLAHNGGTNWYGSKATANTYVTPAGGLYRVTATRALNLIDMGSAKSVRKAMKETLRRTANALSANLQAALGNHDFAYAIPKAVATVAEMALQYGLGNGNWVNNTYVNRADIDNAIPLAAGDPTQLPLAIGSVIQVFAGQNSANAVTLDDPGFLRHPDRYVVLRKDVTAGDSAFANALLTDLNDPNLFHGLHVPLGMKFGGWTGTINEVLIKNSPANLQVVAAPVQVGGPEADMRITHKTIGVDDSWLAGTWRFLGGNR